MLSTCSVLLAVFALAIAAPNNYGNKKIVIAETTPASDLPVEFDCSGKEDGWYVLGCSQEYFSCWNEMMSKESCQDGMMFNQESAKCDFSDNIFECTGLHATTLLEEEPLTTTLSYDNYETSTLEPIVIIHDKPTTRSYHQRPTTVIRDLPTTRAAYHQRPTTVIRDLPTTRSYAVRKTTIVADVPTDSYDNYETTTSEPIVIVHDEPKDSYDNYETTTLAAEPTTRSYYQRPTTVLADLPTTRRAYTQRPTTVIRDLPTTRSYGYRTTVIRDLPTTRAAYHQRPTTVIRDLPTTRSYNKVIVAEPTTRMPIKQQPY